MLIYPCFYRRQGFLTYLQSEEDLQDFGEAFELWHEYREIAEQEIHKVVVKQMNNYRELVKKLEKMRKLEKRK